LSSDLFPPANVTNLASSRTGRCRFNHLFLFNHFKRDTDGLADELKQVKRKLDDAYKENALLHERYEL